MTKLVKPPNKLFDNKKHACMCWLVHHTSHSIKHWS